MLDFIISSVFMFLLASLIVSALTDSFHNGCILEDKCYAIRLLNCWIIKTIIIGTKYFKYPSVKQMQQEKLPIKLGLFGNFFKSPSHIYYSSYILLSINL